MLQLHEITLDLKERYEAMLGSIPTSFYRFPNIYMARNSASLKYAEIDGAFCLAAVREDPEESYGFFPLNAEEKVLRNAFLTMREELDLHRFYVPGQVLPQVETECPGMFRVESSRGDFDYLYDTQALIKLSGKKYHGKKGHFKKFVSTYDFEYLEIDGSNFDLCRPMMDAWFAAHPEVNSGHFNEIEVINTLIENFDALQLRAGALRVGKEICAFSIGELAAPDIAHIIIEKADIRFQGAYAAMNQQFLEHAWADTRLVNREEDMGNPGLRKAKESYRPVAFNEVYRLTFADEATEPEEV